MEAHRESSEPAPETAAAASAAAAASVLDNDDLLREILLRLDLPTALVRAAAVSRRWLRCASDPTFLRRFRARNPPRLLGVYVNTGQAQRLRFVPLARGPELAAVVRRGSFDLGEEAGSVWDCRNGRLLVFVDGKYVVRSPLHPERGTDNLPGPPIPAEAYTILLYFSDFLFHESSDDSVSCTSVTVMCTERQAWVHLSDLQAGVWGEGRYSGMIDIPVPGSLRGCEHHALLANGKLYMICLPHHIIGFDLPSTSSFCIELPDGVQYEYLESIGLSCAKGSGFFLIHLKGFQISVWLHRTDHSSIGTWKLIDTIFLPQAFGHLAELTWSSLPDVVRVAAAGDNADFVLLRIQNKLFYMHISSRTVEEVYEANPAHGFLYGVYPFMMPWPPTFPVLNGGNDHDQ
ncbi:hypothetical protein GQ55_1G140500 [Panicum hallii var. hallii]|uniref:Uncharacterized protein n=1 Tax=Panicum hallii var. hallii TaxID=1504633 RepID=A0A2T7F594_9POAL|nr:hypothetical protein GQ55_1G140500 [Panicum hallii var. hallii]PUZ75253.1 hypothetical protein GQ55_1G140500 [Panicum hallii var. hallii]